MFLTIDGTDWMESTPFALTLWVWLKWLSRWVIDCIVVTRVMKKSRAISPELLGVEWNCMRLCWTNAIYVNINKTHIKICLHYFWSSYELLVLGSSKCPRISFSQSTRFTNPRDQPVLRMTTPPRVVEVKKTEAFSSWTLSKAKHHASRPSAVTFLSDIAHFKNSRA